MHILIIGADSSIGSFCFNYFKSRGIECLGTSRRASSGYIYLDLLQPSSFQNIPLNLITHAVVCAGLPNVAYCQQHASQSYQVNVRAICDLFSQLTDYAIHILFLSTSLVFSDSQPCLSPLAKPMPICVYGQHKHHAERYLLSISSKSCILRMTKVLALSNVLFDSWLADLSLGRPIIAFEDKYISPVSIDHVAQSVLSLIQSGSSGIFHLSSSYPITYYQLACHLCHLLGVSVELVRPVRATSLHIPNSGSPHLCFTNTGYLLPLPGAPLEVISKYFISWVSSLPHGHPNKI